MNCAPPAAPVEDSGDGPAALLHAVRLRTLLRRGDGRVLPAPRARLRLRGRGRVEDYAARGDEVFDDLLVLLVLLLCLRVCGGERQNRECGE
jgi:hypothetical protein